MLDKNIPDKFDDIGFDTAPHNEAIEKMLEYGYADQSIRAAIRVRQLVFIRFKTCVFGFGIASDLTEIENIKDCFDTLASEVIYSSESLNEAVSVLGDVQAYFKRHFPGRCILSTDVPTGLKHEVVNSVFVVIREADTL